MESASVAAGHGAHEHEPHGPPEANRSSRVEAQYLGMLLFIISEIMLFGAFFTAYFFIRVVNEAGWFPIDGKDLPVAIAGVNSAILLSSSLTMHWALEGARRGNRRALPQPFLDRMYDDFDRATRAAVLRLYRSVDDVAKAGERRARALRPLDRPALVLWGRHDPYLRVAHAERQREAFPRAEVRVLEHSGHWPFVDDPVTVAGALRAFLDRQPEHAVTPQLEAA